MRVRAGSAPAGRYGAESPAGTESVPARIRQLVWPAVRSHAWGRRNFVPRISEENRERISSAGPLRALLQVHVSVRLQRYLEVIMNNQLSRAREQAVRSFFRLPHGRGSVVAAMFAVSCFAQPPQLNPDDVQLTMAPVQGNVYVLMGDGGNITVQVGKDGVMLVDTGFAPLASKAMAEIRKLSDGPIRWIVNTHVHNDHTGGNAEMVKLGRTGESVT